jgi:hypothetical protein
LRRRSATLGSIMLTDREASHLVLAYIEQASSEREAYAVQSCSLSEQEDYWVVRANSADYVLVKFSRTQR